MSHLRPRTEETYLSWRRRYWAFRGQRDPVELGAEHVTASLNTLVPDSRVSASTQHHALTALLFLHREGQGLDLPWLNDLVHAKSPVRLPVVLSRDELRAVLAKMNREPRLMATLLCGADLRLLECCRLRLKVVDFAPHQVKVRRGKSDKGRATMQPGSIQCELAAHLERVRARHAFGLTAGAGWGDLLGALARKLRSAGREWPWQRVFPATRVYSERETGHRRRHHLPESVLQHAVRYAALESGIAKRATCHTFRRSFATHSFEDGSDIRTVRELLGLKDVATTMIYIHVLNCGPAGVRSPADRLFGGAP